MDWEDIAGLSESQLAKIMKQLQKLEAAANQILEEASSEVRDDPVNWGGLVAFASLEITSRGDFVPMVFISPASHFAVELKAFVHRKLEERGFGSVAVYCEW